MKAWSGWAPFPDPRKMEYIHAPFGPGVYELRRVDTKQLVLRGQGGNCAYRMTSLLPRPFGQGTRNNSSKRDYVYANLSQIEYRSCPCGTKDEAKKLEAHLNKNDPGVFPR